MGLITNPFTTSEYIAIGIHSISLISLGLVIYLTYNRNNLVTAFSIANIGQHCSKLFRLVLFGFTMENAPRWSCYVHAITNFLTVGMESYISMLFALRLWLMITRKNSMKMWLLEHSKYLTYICGLAIPSVLSIFSILPQLLKGKSFVVPPNAENCITGYRQNAWQIILSGPGTTLPPFFLAASFGIHIAIVLCTVSTQNIMKDVKKFSTISYSSWIRMLYFGILFSLVVVINIIGDVKNSRAMIKNNTPEPGIKNIGIAYYLTAAVGLGVLLIFGTTVEAKKKLSSLFKTSIMGLSSTLKNSKMSQSNISQSMSANKSFNTSNITIDSNATLIQKNTSYDNLQVPILQGLNSTTPKSTPLSTPKSSTKSIPKTTPTPPLPNIKSSVKVKRPEDEYEASVEFNKFMKTVNEAVIQEDSMINMNNEINYYNYSQNPNSTRMIGNGSITPRMMIPIQKFSPERIQQQQIQNYQNPYNNHNNNNNTSFSVEYSFESNREGYDSNREDNQRLLNTHLFRNNSNDDYYINMNNNESNNYIRNATYTEEIVYPAKASTSMRIKQIK